MLLKKNQDQIEMETGLDQHYLKKITDIKAKINKTIADSETLSSSVYESIPKFEEETQKIIAFISEFLSQLKNEGTESNASFLGKLSALKNSVTLSLQNIATLVDAVDYVFNNIFNTTGENSFVEQVIQQARSVESALADLNSIALNASITSSQLGTKGGAFSILSREIERQSEKLVKHFDNITRIINRSFPDIASFKKTLDSFGEFASMKRDFHKLIERFSSVENSLVELQQSMKAGTESAADSFPDILANMVGQDIFRQQMEHIIEFFIDLEKRGKAKQDPAKELSFLKFVLEISHDILSESIKDFSEAFEKVSEDFNHFVLNFNDGITKPAQKFAIYFSEDDRESLYRIIQEVMVITVKNTVFMEEVLHGLVHIRESFIHFKDNVMALDDEVSNSARLVKRFRTMNILIKAELARLEDQMGKKAQDIRAEFDEAIIKVTNTTVDLNQISKNIFKLYQENADHFDQFKTCCSELIKKDELKVLFKSMENVISETHGEYKKMMIKFEHSMAFINSIQQRFNKDLDQLNRENEDIYRQIEAFEQEVPAYHEEFLNDPTLKELSEKFTTYRERVKASEHLDIEDVGTQGGEFTLF
ncbi:MAG TPA: hypothetical protein P5107_09575 [Thermotogota bacterium]|nr:hypothetical protein [Thermotogota bacterium]